MAPYMVAVASQSAILSERLMWDSVAASPR